MKLFSLPDPDRAEGLSLIIKRLRSVQLSSKKEEQGSGAPEFSKYKNKISLKFENIRQHLKTHGFIFCGIQGFLILLYALATPGSHPWFLYPLGVHAAFLANHFAAGKELAVKEQECRAVPGLDSEGFRLFRKIQRKRSAFRINWITSLSIALYLVMINFITKGHFP